MGYAFGWPLPIEMQDWVREDILAPGATRRYLLRWNVPIIPLLALFLLIPGPIWIPLAMILLLLLPWLYFSIALMTVWQRHRLQQHGLDPQLMSAKARARANREREDYERRFGRAV